MSSDQQTLSDALEGTDLPRAPEASGTVETEQGAAWAPQSGGQTERHCLNCKSHVDVDFARVFGDNENNVFACLNCAPYAAVRDGAAADPDHEWRHEL